MGVAAPGCHVNYASYSELMPAIDPVPGSDLLLASSDSTAPAPAAPGLFDAPVDRRGTLSMKWDGAARYGRPADVLPAWVADMDFPVPACVTDALRKRVDHGVYGYSDPGPGYVDALATWFTGRLGYVFDPAWVVPVPGVVPALSTAIRALTAPGDGVLIQQPVYYPFKEQIESNGRRVVVSELILPDAGLTLPGPVTAAATRMPDRRHDSGLGLAASDMTASDTAAPDIAGQTMPGQMPQRKPWRYEIDFADLERCMVEGKVTLFVLCNPHNPGGVVWTAQELTELVRLCVKHDVLIFSDEIHCDFVFPHTLDDGSVRRHHVLPALCPQAADRILLATAPSKTFNLAGLFTANMFISNSGMRRAFTQEMHRQGFSHMPVTGLLACEAAYRDGGPWADALVDYIASNMRHIDHVLADSLPAVSRYPSEGTYLAWLDMRRLRTPAGEPVTCRDIDRQLTRPDMTGPDVTGPDVTKPDGSTTGGLWLTRGDIFGAGGQGFMRLNAACPRTTLDQALDRLVTSLRRWPAE